MIDTGASIFAVSDPKPSFVGFTVSVDMSDPSEDERDELLERIAEAAQEEQKVRRDGRAQGLVVADGKTRAGDDSRSLSRNCAWRRDVSHHRRSRAGRDE